MRCRGSQLLELSGRLVSGLASFGLRFAAGLQLEVCAGHLVERATLEQVHDLAHLVVDGVLLAVSAGLAGQPSSDGVGSLPVGEAGIQADLAGHQPDVVVEPL